MWRPNNIPGDIVSRPKWKQHLNDLSERASSRRAGTLAGPPPIPFTLLSKPSEEPLGPPLPINFKDWPAGAATSISPDRERGMMATSKMYTAAGMESPYDKGSVKEQPAIMSQIKAPPAPPEAPPKQAGSATGELKGRLWTPATHTPAKYTGATMGKSSYTPGRIDVDKDTGERKLIPAEVETEADQQPGVKPAEVREALIETPLQRSTRLAEENKPKTAPTTYIGSSGNIIYSSGQGGMSPNNSTQGNSATYIAPLVRGDTQRTMLHSEVANSLIHKINALWGMSGVGPIKIHRADGNFKIEILRNPVTSPPVLPVPSSQGSGSLATGSVVIWNCVCRYS